jgi:uncharacterized protein YkwD
MRCRIAWLWALCAALGCQEPIKPTAPPALPATRTFDVWDDGLAFYHPDASGLLVQVADVDKVPHLWRELIVVDFDDDVDVKGSYYVVTLSRDGSPQAQATLVSGQALAARILGQALAAHVHTRILALHEEEPQASAPRASVAAPARRRPPSAAGAAGEPAGIVVEGITRGPTLKQAMPLKPLGGSPQAALPAAEHRRELVATLSTLNEARERGMRCPGVPDGRRVAVREQDILGRVAQAVALDMAQTGNVLRKESDVQSYVLAAGYKGQIRSLTTEGVYSGRAFATKYLESRCATLMDPRLRSFGFGAARTNTGYYWVMILGDA